MRQFQCPKSFPAIQNYFRDPTQVASSLQIMGNKPGTRRLLRDPFCTITPFPNAILWYTHHASNAPCAIHRITSLFTLPLRLGPSFHLLQAFGRYFGSNNPACTVSISRVLPFSLPEYFSFASIQAPGPELPRHIQN